MSPDRSRGAAPAPVPGADALARDITEEDEPGFGPEPEACGPTILVDAQAWRAHVRAAERIAARAARAAGTDATILLSSDRAVKRLNARHRAKNKPTNVLTFEPPPGFGGGDIILALETVAREARAYGRPCAHHLAHLVVHGALHLQGHDHLAAGEARRMEMEEARILHRLRVPNPWKRR